jgi:sodium/potassium-transporting ATPase subunit alpha
VKNVITGEELHKLSAKEWDKLIAMKYLVFARTTPEHKLLIVEQCRKRGL